MNFQQIKANLKRISQDFNLKYNLNWFNVIWITKRHARYLEYLGMCFDPIYTRFGKTIEKRLKNIGKFESSKEYKKIKKEFSGQAITKEEVIKGINDCKKIGNPKLRKELLDLHNLILRNLKEDNLVLLTKTNNKKQKEILLNSILFHEWIHLLLMKNKIYFKSKGDKYWKYDEGLVTYIEYRSKNRLSYLESTKNKVKYPSQKLYFVYAIKFKNLLRNIKTSKERKDKILNLLNLLPARAREVPLQSRGQKNFPYPRG